MKKQMIWTAVAAAAFAVLSMGANAQNIAIVNGKAVPTARAEALAQQVARSGRPITPEVEAQIKEEVIAREIFMQEAQRLSTNLKSSWPVKPF
jgi:peptidyl-prolyl cis-trans isomerase C